MDIWDANKLLLFIAFVIPGFVSLKTYELLFPGAPKESDKLLIDAVAYSSINYALLLWPIYSIETHQVRQSHGVRQRSVMAGNPIRRAVSSISIANNFLYFRRSHTEVQKQRPSCRFHGLACTNNFSWLVSTGVRCCSSHIAPYLQCLVHESA